MSITVVFSHGKESGPWGKKITAMAALARDLGTARSNRWIIAESMIPARGSRSSSRSPRNYSRHRYWWARAWGATLSAAAAARLQPRGLFLLAPAFYMPGFEAYTPQDVACPTAIVHGWHDDIVPVENSIRWAREHERTLHVLNSDHRLEDRIEAICALLRGFLAELAVP